MITAIALLLIVVAAASFFIFMIGFCIKELMESIRVRDWVESFLYSMCLLMFVGLVLFLVGQLFSS